MPNSTTMSGFLLGVFSDEWELRVLQVLSFSLMYWITLVGNLLIVAVTTIDQSLHTPMYFFFQTLSILDACYISVTVPNSCISFLLSNSSISKTGCTAQVSLVVFFICMELLFLTAMAHDRYVAICRPLVYPVIMSSQICLHMTLASLISGLMYAGVHTGHTFRLPFRPSRDIHQFFCDIPSLLKLSCSDTFSNEVIIVVSGLGIGGGCFIFIIRSYVHIFSTVFKFPRGTDRKKAFSMCVPHILVVSVFLGLGFYMYLWLSAASAASQDLVFSVIYSMVPPLFNPVIYSLRNEQIKRVITKITKRMFYSGNL